MLDLMYELPEHNNEGAEYVIDRAAVQHRRPLAELRKARKESA